MTKRIVAVVAFLSTVLLHGCASTRPAQPPTIDQYLELIRGATVEALDKIRADVGNDGGADRVKIAVTPVVTDGQVDLTGNRGSFQDGISNEITNSRLFLPINQELIVAAMKGARIGRASELGLKEPRERFLNILASNGSFPQYLIFANFNSLKEVRDGCVVKLRVTLTLKVVDSTNGVERYVGSHPIMSVGG